MALFLLILNLFFVNVVFATDDTGSGGGSMGGRDDDDLVEYDFYDGGGHKKGYIVLNDQIKNSSKWVIFMGSNGQIYLIDFDKWYPDYNNLYFGFYGDVGEWNLTYSGYNAYKPISFDEYDKENEAWISNAGYKMWWGGSATFSMNSIIAYKNVDIYFWGSANDTLLRYDLFKYTPSLPFVQNLNDVALNNFDKLDINLQDCYDYGAIDGELSGYRDVLNYNFSYITVNIMNKNTGSLIYNKNFMDCTTSNFILDDDGNPHLIIPKENMLDFEKGQEYTVSLTYTFKVVRTVANNPYMKFETLVSDDFEFNFMSGVGIDPDNPDPNDPFKDAVDNFSNSIKDQNEILKENNETNKNIFQKIGDIFDLLNPFSENFFAYKLIELLLEALKSLFIPSDNFFNDWLADLNSYFGDRFGILYYPFEVVIDFLTRFVNACDNMASSGAVINVPEMKFMGVKLIGAFTYDFNSLLTNDTLKMIHNIYLVVVDVIFSLMLVNLAKNTFAEVFGGRFSDEVIGDMTADDRSYKKYERYQSNKNKYRSENGG